MSTIIALEAQNIKRLKAISITPDGKGLVVIGGQNGQGKTSTLDAIEYALGGKPNVDRPIRDGAKKAFVVVETEELIINRTFSPSGSKLVVESKGGGIVKSPQALLDKLVGQLSFDPLDFSRQTAKQQSEILRELAGVDFTAMDSVRAKTYEERTMLNREIKSTTAQVESSNINPLLPKEEVSVAELSAKFQASAEANRKIDSLESNISEAEQCINNFEDDIHDIKLKLKSLEDGLEAEQEALTSGKKLLESSERIDLTELTANLESAEDTNSKIRETQKAKGLITELEDKKKKADEMSKRIKRIDSQKAEMLAEANLPVEGLSFDEDGVTYEGIPFSQCSGAEQLRISLAMGLAANPDLKVILIRDGSLLDDKSLEMVAKMADEAEAQVWMERVGEGKEVSVVIEDGEIRE